MLSDKIKAILEEENDHKLSAKELLEMEDEDIENYIESLDFDDMIKLLIDVATVDAPLARILSPQACKDLNEILDSDFKTVEVKEIILFLNSIASDSLNDEQTFFIYGVVAMLRCMYEEKKKEYKPKHAKTSAN
jgi:hypothetical protein